MQTTLKRNAVIPKRIVKKNIKTAAVDISLNSIRNKLAKVPYSLSDKLISERGV